MTVGELIEKLQMYPKDLPVICDGITIIEVYQVDACEFLQGCKYTYRDHDNDIVGPAVVLE